MCFPPIVPREAWASPASKHQPNQCWPNKSATTWPSEATRSSTLSTSLANLLPVIPTAGLKLPGQPPQYAGLLDLLREVFSLNCINTASL
jgi:hypothetical protein